MMKRIMWSVTLFAGIFAPSLAMSQQDLPYYLKDRGAGIPLSQFGTYIEKGQWAIYPFYEYYNDQNLEYEPFDFGWVSQTEYRGKYKAHEGLIFVGIGLSERVALEFEAGVISAELEKSGQDTSPLSESLEKSGLNDVEGQIRYRWNFENAGRPEVFSYFEYVLPTGEKNSLIGTSSWEFKLGTGLVKGFRWGTLTFRAAVDYDTGEKAFGIGEYAIEYLKRVSLRLRFFVMMEGSDDEIALVPEIQWFVGPKVYLKAGNGFGVTSKATDFAPEVGIMILIR